MTDLDALSAQQRELLEQGRAILRAARAADRHARAALAAITELAEAFRRFVYEWQQAERSR